METYTFTLILTGFRELSEEVEDALFVAGCSDALLGIRDSVPFLDFDREALSFREAVLSAIKNVERAGYQVVRVEPDELVTASEIAARTGRSRESIRLLVSGQRGPGGFPPPLSGQKRRSRLWRWSEVAHWFSQHGLFTSEGSEQARLVAALNGALELRRHAPSREGLALLRELGT